jgi:predicted O-methyltransferase YrrM
MLFVPPGHFYSPIPSPEDVRPYLERLVQSPPQEIEGLNLNHDGQLRLLAALQTYYKDLPFSERKSEGTRYFYENPAYSYSDAIFLYAMIRHQKPQRIVEIGSGYSSCVMLDTNARFFANAIEITCIEPYPDLLHTLMHPGDRERVRVLAQRVQDVPLAHFEALSANDILFVDSTHVSKVGSDVNHILFHILPRLRSGVHIHFHDVFWPFEYPRAWLDENRAWNELYMLRAFLQFNSSFRITLFNTYLEARYPDYFHAHMPLCMRNPGGSIWLQKV